jgi:hypothetical protein
VITPSPDQATTIALLTTCGELCGIHVDAGAIDETADEPCALDYSHGLGTVFVLGDVHCLICSVELVLAQESVAVDVLRIPGVEVGETDTRAAA